MKITVKESTVVKPAEVTPTTNLWLSSLDIMMPMNFHGRVAFFYRANGANNFFDPMVIKEALGRTLVHFHPVAGRHSMNNGRLEINCNGEGVLCVHAEADGVLDDLGDFDPRPEIGLTPNVDYSQGISAYPLLLVQVTHFKCGGVCIGVTADHHLFDGIAFAHFANTWAEFARGQNITLPPFLDRKAVLSGRNLPQPHPDQLSHIENNYTPPSEKIPESMNTSVYKRFRLTRDQINALKEKCKPVDGSIRYSTFEVLAGHVWFCVTLARQLPKDHETKLTIPVNGRSRLQPPIPLGYFGNALIVAEATLLASELQSNPVTFSVYKVHEALARVDDKFIRSTIDYLESMPNLTAFERPVGYACGTLVVVSWTGIPYYDVDFGWGKPINVGPWMVTINGESNFLPTNDGSVCYGISLHEEHMRLFEKLFYDI